MTSFQKMKEEIKKLHEENLKLKAKIQEIQDEHRRNGIERNNREF